MILIRRLRWMRLALRVAIASLGDLYIRNSSDITNLNGLANITSVGGDLQIYKNAALTNLDGLANFSSVGGSEVLKTRPHQP